MSKRMRIMLISMGILFGAIFLYKFIMSLLLNHYLANQSHVVTVSTMKVDYQKWQPKLLATGSLRAIKGVNVTTQLAGMVQTIYFTPGAFVNKGDVLVQLQADTDIAQLEALQASAELARITYERDKAQFAVNAVSKQTVDTDYQNLKNLQAQVEGQAALVQKKTIRAPFTGRLGISAVNPGQFLNPQDKIVNMQTLDPIYADFFMPQQFLSQLAFGQAVNVKIDAYPNQNFPGKITTIDPGVDPNTRNVGVEATLDNPKYQLAPGMFVNVEVISGQPQEYLTLPQTAVSFNPYGSVVFVVSDMGKDKKDEPILVANQVFVTTGEVRGDQVAILDGLKKGDVVVTSGQLKLKNGTQVAINNTVQPSNNPAPTVSNEH